MKFVLCVLFATLCVALSTVSAVNIRELEGYNFQNRIRTGHLNEFPYADLYKNYVQIFIAPAWEGTKVHSSDAYKNYAASAEHCFTVFDAYISNDYQIEKIEKLVELDSCLGYLYDPDYVEIYHDEDKQRPIVAQRLDTYINNENLKKLYDGTIIHQLEREPAQCISNLLMRTIQIKNQYKNLACNNHHIELLNMFGDCHKSIQPESLRTEDSYISILYKLIKAKGRECFEAELMATNDAVREKYANNYWNKIPSWSIQSRQVTARMWPAQIKNLFAALLAAPKDKELNVREVLAFARALKRYKVYTEDYNYVDTLLKNLAKYADKTINTRKAMKSLNTQDDDGRLRYQVAIDDLCVFFRTTDYEKNYDYATSFSRLVRMLQFPELFDINEKAFVRSVINGYEVAPIYAGVALCNIISYTEGTITRVTGRGTISQQYDVKFKANTDGMLQWPDPGYY